MKYVLLPYDIDKFFSLTEALNWVAFKAPIAGINMRFSEKFENPRSIFANEQYPFPLGEVFQLNLPEQPDYPNISSPDMLDLYKERGVDLQISQAEFEELRRKSVDAFAEYEERRQAWQDAYDAILEPAKASLFLALRNGNITAYGGLAYVPKDGAERTAWKKDSNDFDDNWQPAPAIKKSQSENRKINFENVSENHLDDDEELYRTERYNKIPSTFWRIDGIDWESSEARSPSGIQADIHFESAELFSVFPPPDPIAVQINSYAGVLILDDGHAATNAPIKKATRGRPPRIDWEAFHLEMARRVANNSLPQKQESCIADIQQWCMQRWGVTPERSTLSEKISPYYREFKSK